METIKIRKVRITNKQDAMAMVVSKLIKKSKKIISPSESKKEQELFFDYLLERNSIKKAMAFSTWKRFISKCEKTK